MDDICRTPCDFAVLVQKGAVLLDMVSLFPAENGVEGSISPFRSDILSLIRGLKPRHDALSLSTHPSSSCSLIRHLGCDHIMVRSLNPVFCKPAHKGVRRASSWYDENA